MTDNFESTQRIPINELSVSVEKLKDEIRKVIVGQEKMVELMLISLLADGHLLIEGVPGVAKTLAAKLMAKLVQAKFSRIQFTPDLMPGDVIGTAIFNSAEARFHFSAGPIFGNLILIDEINRAPAKTQSALFEVMEERQITVDGVTHKMEFPFMVLATQNPIEQEGTYRLPEAQLDRFLFKIQVGYPGLEEEIAILLQHQQQPQNELLLEMEPVISIDTLIHCRQIVQQVLIDPKLVEYIARIVNETRNNPNLYLGASTRASLALLKSAKVLAAMRNRDFVIPEDIKEMAFPVLRHRIILTPEKEMEGLTADLLIENMLKTVEIPR